MKKDFSNLFDKSKYQVFLYVSPAALPFVFAIHSWFLVNDKGKISRWELAADKDYVETSWGYVCKNLSSYWDTACIIPYIDKPRFKGRLLYCISGDSDSLAKKMSDFIHNSGSTYPLKDNYRFRGPNSNTYSQWVIDNNPGFKAKLPWNAVGKGFSIKF